MKKALALALVIATLAGCSSAGVSQSEYDAVVAERDALKAQVEELLSQNNTPSEPETPSSSETEPHQEASEDVATRKNPATIGDVITADVESLVWGNCSFELALVDIERGQAALDKIMASNQFNDAPPEGKEYIIASFNFKNVKDLTGTDAAYEINSAQFSFCSGDFVKEDQTIFVSLDTQLSAEVFEDAEVTGDVVFLSDEDDDCYAVFYDTLWFSLSE